MKRFTDRFEEALAEALPRIAAMPQLREACTYALYSGGKRLRPCVTLMVAEALGQSVDVSPSALCIEYLHTASLIADDLPCMDDAVERRGRPALHKAYGESTAILTSYALIAAAYRELARGDARFCGERLRVALDLISQANGYAAEGQWLDLNQESSGEGSLRRLHCEKTGSLFWVAFALGWLFGGGVLELLFKVKELGNTVGWIYQLSDDLMDATQDRRPHNAALFLGGVRVQELLEAAFVTVEALLDELSLRTEPLKLLLAQLKNKAMGAFLRDASPESAFRAH